MKVLGINALSHDASIALIDDNEILFAAHSERYSGIKNDLYLNQEILNESLRFGTPDVIAFYEKPYLKKTRQLFAGQYNEVFQTKNIFHNYFKQFDFPKTPIKYLDHHKCHAAASYFTSPFDNAVIVCIDSIGEWSTLSIWEGNKDDLKLLKKVNYPHSLGILYSAFSQRCGLKPNEDEYILMGMAGWGYPSYADKIKKDFIKDKFFKLKINCHKGIPNDYLQGAYLKDIAASIQQVTEEVIENIIKQSKHISNSKNLVYCGGVALNCLANRLIPKYFNDIWIMPNPGDSGSSIGAASLINGRLNWKGPYLGHNIKGDYPVKSLLEELLKGNIVGVANGRAEFGPRAFGNRSLLADPRGNNIKDKINDIKHRQKFRPFSPSILEEYAAEYFNMIISKSPYMQYVMTCKYPDKFPAIVHVDNTSRVHTVNKKESPGYWNLINEFYKKTGCPMLLNTSLNVKGQPLVNNSSDAIQFGIDHNIKVFNHD